MISCEKFLQVLATLYLLNFSIVKGHATSIDIGLNVEVNGDHNEIEIDQFNDDLPNVIDDIDIQYENVIDEMLIKQLIEENLNMKQQLNELQTHYEQLLTSYNQMFQNQFRQQSQLKQLSTVILKQRECSNQNFTAKNLSSTAVNEIGAEFQYIRRELEQHQNDIDHLNHEFISNQIQQQKSWRHFVQEQTNRIVQERTEITTKVEAIEYGCPGVTFHIPNDDKDWNDSVSYHGYVPAMKEATFCAWIEASHYKDYATVWSYAGLRYINEWFMSFSAPSTLFFGRSELLFNLSVSQRLGNQKVHVCSWFSSTRQQHAVYINALRADIQNASIQGLTGEGSLVIGRKQRNEEDQYFNASAAFFSGNVTNFLIWPRILSDEEILHIAEKCKCPSDFTVAMTMDQVQMHGQAEYQPLRKCPTLE